jgi:putative cardiolipin synthase
VATLHPDAPTELELQQARQQLADFVEANRESAYLEALRTAPLADSLRSGQLDLRWGDARVVADDPDKLISARGESQFLLATALRPYFDALDQELIIFSPYFVPGKQGVALLTGLAQRGVHVRILTNSLVSTDVAVVHAGYAKYRKALLRAGVELYEMDHQMPQEGEERQSLLKGSSRASLHAKSFVLDRETLFIGSLNLDPRSVVENSEIGVLLTEPVTAAQMSDWFHANIASKAYRLALVSDEYGRDQIRWYADRDGTHEGFKSDPHAGWMQRFVVGIARLLPIESQL